jgi:N-acetylglucosaminyldiphosphoundecaprenol N-acetyl-beta-D-mannosaminyltransferase
MTARRDPALQKAINHAEIATSDGVPLVWGLRWTVRPEQQRVYGPELMRRGLAEQSERGWKHYLYGSTTETLDLLVEKIHQFAPDAEIVGRHAPPFRPLTPEEQEAVLAEIRSRGADLVWVGLGMPKQELWMHEVRQDLPGVALLGVGAAFDFLAGTVKQAPEWMQRSGLEWLYRLIQEPRRLWRRYLFNNPAFAVLLAFQVAKTKLNTWFRSK